MKELPINFIGTGEVKGFEFIQIEKSNKAYMYSVFCPDIDELHYEVFSRKESKDNTSMIGGIKVFFPAKVRYPNSSHDWLYSYRDLTSAREKFKELSEYESKRNTSKRIC